MTNGAKYFQSALEQTQTMTKIWMDSVSHMTDAMFTAAPGTPSPEHARQMRDSFLTVIAKSTEQFMRSEPFLNALGQSLDWALDFRKQYNQMMTEIHHGACIPAHEDVRTLAMVMRHLEERLNARLNRMEDLLETIASRLDESSSDQIDADEEEQHKEPVRSKTALRSKHRGGRSKKGRR